jgi:hypothetical protein
MFDTANAKQQFAKLSKGDKLTKLQAMLSLVESSLGTYSDILQHIASQWLALPEETIVSYHDLLLADVALLQGDSLDLFVDELKKFQQQLHQKDIDDTTSKDHDDADALLQNLYI